MPDQYIVGIDIGASKLCAAVAIRDAIGQTRYVGHGSTPSEGYRSGEVLDEQQLAAAFQRALDEARYLIGTDVVDVAVCVSGAEITTIDRHGSVNLEPGRPIDPTDIQRAISNSFERDSYGQHTVHRVVRSLAVDGAVTRDPTGRTGRRLEIVTRDFAMPTRLIERLGDAAEAAGVRIHTLIPEGIAAATAATTEGERVEGVAVIDVGSGGADLAVYIDGDLVHVDALPLGGNHITADLAGIIDISTERAETLKRQFGAIDRESDDALMEWNQRTIAALQRKAAEGDIAPAAVRSIVAARVIQIMDAMHASMQRAGVIDRLGAGVVLTGGTSQVKGIDDIASAIFGLPVRTGAVLDGDGFPAITDVAVVPSVGLVRYCATRGLAPMAAKRQSRRLGSGAVAFVHPAVQRVMHQSDTLSVPPSDFHDQRTGTMSWGHSLRTWMREFIPVRNDD